jgi:hypothetical protein
MIWAPIPRIALTREDAIRKGLAQNSFAIHKTVAEADIGW